MPIAVADFGNLNVCWEVEKLVLTPGIGILPEFSAFLGPQVERVD